MITHLVFLHLLSSRYKLLICRDLDLHRPPERIGRKRMRYLKSDERILDDHRRARRALARGCVRTHSRTQCAWREQGSRVPSSSVYQQAKCVSRTTASAQCGVSAGAICRARAHFYMRAPAAPVVGPGILSLESTYRSNKDLRRGAEGGRETRLRPRLKIPRPRTPSRADRGRFLSARLRRARRSPSTRVKSIGRHCFAPGSPLVRFSYERGTPRIMEIQSLA